MSKKEFADKVWGTTPSYFSQLMSTKAPKPINDEYAAKAESYFGKPSGWLDWPADYAPNAAEKTGGIPDIAREWIAELPKNQQEEALRIIQAIRSNKPIDEILQDMEEPPPEDVDTGVHRMVKRRNEGRDR